MEWLKAARGSTDWIAGKKFQREGSQSLEQAPWEICHGPRPAGVHEALE